MLHLREVRYYSIVIFLGACIINQYVNYTFIGRISFYQYLILMTIFLVILFNTLVPVFFIFLAFIGLYETFQFFFHLSKKYLDEKGIDHLLEGEVSRPRLQANDHSHPSVILKKELKRYLRAISPLIVAFVLIIPLLIYFKTFYVSGETNKFYNYSSQVYFEHIFSVFEYFGKYEFIYLAVFLKIVFLILYYRVRNIVLPLRHQDKPPFNPKPPLNPPKGGTEEGGTEELHKVFLKNSKNSYLSIEQVKDPDAVGGAGSRERGAGRRSRRGREGTPCSSLHAPC